MSINCLASVQSIINKKSAAGPLTQIVLTDAYNPAPHNPYAYFSAQTAIVRTSANSAITACSCTITNQAGNYTFANGVYSFLCSSTSAGSPGAGLVDAFSGTSVYNVWLSPLNYNASGIYFGSASTVTSGTTVTGEWQQIKLPYKLIITTYSVNSNNAGGGSQWNQMWTMSKPGSRGISDIYIYISRPPRPRRAQRALSRVANMCLMLTIVVEYIHR